MIKAVFCDLDGTLLNDNGEISESTKNVIKRVNSLGVAIVLVSGRHKYEMNGYFEELDLYKNDKNYMISCDGVYIYDNQGNIVNSPMFFPKQYLNSITKIISDKKHKMIFVTDKRDFCFFSLNWLLRKIFRRTSCNAVFTSKQLEKKEIEKVILISSKLKQKKEILENISIDLSYHTNGNDKLEILNKLSSKYYAACEVNRYLDLTENEILYFGNEENDGECLSSFPNSYAVDNATRDIKELAKYVCASNNDEGVKKIIEEIFFKDDI